MCEIETEKESQPGVLSRSGKIGKVTFLFWIYFVKPDFSAATVLCIQPLNILEIIKIRKIVEKIL